MLELIIVSCLALIVSFFANRKKTLAGLKMGFKMLMNMLPSFLTVIIGVAIVLACLPKEKLISLLGEGLQVTGFLIASLLGSIALIPGFVAFPLSAVLIKNGVSYSVISVFITTLMMVGVVTFPLEKKFFGFRTALIRNLLSLAGAIIIGIFMSFLWRLL